MRYLTKEITNSYWDEQEKQLLQSFDKLDTISKTSSAIENLENKFPGSLRVSILKGKYFEANRNLKNAKNVYNNLLESINENHELRSRTEQIVAKRNYAMKKSQGKLQEAGEELVKYLAVYQSDASAWHELGLLNVENLDYSAAAFCFEEVLMIDPSNNTVFQLLAECLLSVGDKDAEAARRYAATALFSATKNQKKFSSIRSEVTILLASHKIKNAKEKDLNKKLNGFALSEISKGIQKQKNASLKQAVLSALKGYSVQ